MSTWIADVVGTLSDVVEDRPTVAATVTDVQLSESPNGSLVLDVEVRDVQVDGEAFALDPHQRFVNLPADYRGATTPSEALRFAVADEARDKARAAT